jgi:ADP-dependent NAD(P)H-hydrate dehydratase / NAD(P)H-hydrate epimerase
VSLPDWLDPLPDAAAQRALDNWAIDACGIPGIELMERAGAGLAELVARVVPEGPIAIVCGKGNNGGDGLVAARRLRAHGRDVDVQLLCPAGELHGDARTMCERLTGSPGRPFNPGALFECAGVVDAVLGTGARGVPEGLAGDAIEAMAAAAERGVPVVACDVPSGVDASTGETPGPAVLARATATFHAAKPGLWIAPGKQRAGEVVVVDIGIPQEGQPVLPAFGLISDAVLGELPARGAGSTKFDGGSVLVCGGSRGLTGAPSMAAEGAARAGAGYVTVLVPASLNLVFELRSAEVMSVPLADDTGGSFKAAALAPALERCAAAGALVLGPGLGRSAGAAGFARKLAAQAPVPLLLDADGLNAHAAQTAAAAAGAKRPASAAAAGRAAGSGPASAAAAGRAAGGAGRARAAADPLAALAARDAPTVLTPHGGELARLLGCSGDDVRARRLECAREVARRANAIVVLKGDDTLVVGPDEADPVAVSRGDAPALATAGTGDVLSGVIGALLARGVAPFTAACAGVELHRRAGRLVAQRVGVEGAMARDVIDALPAARAADRLPER